MFAGFKEEARGVGWGGVHIWVRVFEDKVGELEVLEGKKRRRLVLVKHVSGYARATNEVV